LFTARRLLPALAVLAAIVLLLAACGDDDSEDTVDGSGSPSAAASPTLGPPDEITFMAGFKPQANLPFVGVYVAQEKGFFEEQNLDVNIEHVTTPGITFVSSQRARCSSRLRTPPGYWRSTSPNRRWT